MTPELLEKGMVRELVRHINAARKEAKLNPGQPAVVQASAPADLQGVITRNAEELLRLTVSRFEFADGVEGTEISVGENKLVFKIEV
jgi:hypothetical protein